MPGAPEITGLFTVTLGPGLATLFTLMSNISFLELHHTVIPQFYTY